MPGAALGYRDEWAVVGVMVIPASRNYTNAPLAIRVPQARPVNESVPRPVDFEIEPVTPELGVRLIAGLRSLPDDVEGVRVNPVRPFLPAHLTAELVSTQDDCTSARAGHG